MPWSWVRVEWAGTSDKLRNCMSRKGGENARNAETCVREIVDASGGRTGRILFEPNGKFLRAEVESAGVEMKSRILHDLEAEEIDADLMSVDEFEKFLGGDDT